MTTTSIGNGEFVWSADGSTPMSAAQISSQHASNIAALMGNRERFDYVWETSTQRGNQAGMRQGSRGYQLDTKTEWMFDSGAWRLALPWAEFTTSLSGVGDTAPDGPQRVGDFQLDSQQSTDSAFVTTSASGELTLVQPGIYLVSTTTEFDNPITGRTFLEAITSTSLLQRVSLINEETTGALAVPIRTTADNTSIFFNYYKATGGNTTIRTRARVARIG